MSGDKRKMSDEELKMFDILKDVKTDKISVRAALSLLSDKIEALNKIIEMKESERKEWADLCIKKQALIDKIEHAKFKKNV